MDRDVNNYMFPENVTPFNNQVAGHEFTKAKPTIGMMKHKDGYILKPVPHPVYGIREINFYKMLQTTTDPILEQLNSYVPHYLGTKIVRLNCKDVTCICMDDITKDFKMPCVMDVKIGVQTWEPDATERKIQAESVKYEECKAKWGFSIPGFQYYSAKSGNFERRGKDYGKVMTEAQAIKALYSFVNEDVGIRCGLVVSIIQQLKLIHSWFQLQRHFLFYSSSILLAYDADKLKIFVDSNYNEQWIEKLRENRPIIYVTMIDFAHVLPNLNSELDTNYVDSLEKLIYVFENLPELSAEYL